MKRGCPMASAMRTRSSRSRARHSTGSRARPMLSEGAAVAPGVDTILLGCTHYPLVRWAIEEVAGPAVRVVDSATTTALAVREVLDSHGLRSMGDRPIHGVHATGSVGTFTEIARAMFGEGIEVDQAELS